MFQQLLILECKNLLAKCVIFTNSLKTLKNEYMIKSIILQANLE